MPTASVPSGGTGCGGIRAPRVHGGVDGLCPTVEGGALHPPLCCRSLLWRAVGVEGDRVGVRRCPGPHGPGWRRCSRPRRGRRRRSRSRPRSRRWFRRRIRSRCRRRTRCRSRTTGTPAGTAAPASTRATTCSPPRARRSSPSSRASIAKVDNTDDGNGGPERLAAWATRAWPTTTPTTRRTTSTAGQRVGRGQMIGRVGHTGNARTTPPHIHFQVNRCGALDSAEPCTENPYGSSVPLVAGRGRRRRRRPGAVPAVAGQRRAADRGRLGAAGVRLRPGARGQRPAGGGRLERRRDATPSASTGASTPPSLCGTRPARRAAPLPLRHARRHGRGAGGGRLERRRARQRRPVPACGRHVRACATTLARTLPGVAFGLAGRRRRVAGRGRLGRRRPRQPRPLPDRRRRVPAAGRGRRATFPPSPSATPAAAEVPVVGDWDGDGRDTVGTYQRATATFVLERSRPARRPTRGATTLETGEEPAADLLPLVGDWNGLDVVTLDDLDAIFGPFDRRGRRQSPAAGAERRHAPGRGDHPRPQGRVPGHASTTRATSGPTPSRRAIPPPTGAAASSSSPATSTTAPPAPISAWTWKPNPTSPPPRRPAPRWPAGTGPWRATSTTPPTGSTWPRSTSPSGSGPASARTPNAAVTSSGPSSGSAAASSPGT